METSDRYLVLLVVREVQRPRDAPAISEDATILRHGIVWVFCKTSPEFWNTPNLSPQGLSRNLLHEVSRLSVGNRITGYEHDLIHYGRFSSEYICC